MRGEEGVTLFYSKESAEICCWTFARTECSDVLEGVRTTEGTCVYTRSIENRTINIYVIV